jgi:hypothetical protein
VVCATFSRRPVSASDTPSSRHALACAHCAAVTFPGPPRRSCLISAADPSRIAELAAADALTVEAGGGRADRGRPGPAPADSRPFHEVTSGLFDFPAEDLATADRVLAAVTARANAFLAGHAGR